MNHKRTRPRRQPKCRMCTDARWGNSAKSIEGAPGTAFRQELRARISEREQREEE